MFNIVVLALTVYVFGLGFRMLAVFASDYYFSLKTVEVEWTQI